MEAAFGADLTSPASWLWTDLSTRLLPDPITIRRGVTAGSGPAQTTTGSGIRLRNDDGALTPAHPGSPYWPYVDAGTPVRVSVRASDAVLYSDSFTRSWASGWGTNGAYTHTVGGAAGTSFSVNGTQGLITMSVADTVHRVYSTFAAADVDMRFDVSASAVPASGRYVASAVLRLQDASNYLWPGIYFQADGSVRVALLARVAGQIYNAGNTVVAGASWSAGQMWSVRIHAVQDRVRIRVWPAAGAEPPVWHNDASVFDLPAQADWLLSSGRLGCHGYADAAPVPATLAFDNLSVQTPFVPRLEGYLADIQPEFLPQADGSTWSTVVLEVGGIGSRLEKAVSLSESPLRRAIKAAVTPAGTPPIAYWPLEDAEGSLLAASAFPDGQPMQVVGPAVFGFGQGTQDDEYTAAYGTKPMVSVAAGALLSGPVPIASSGSAWAVAWRAQHYIPETAYTDARIMEWVTAAGSSFIRWSFNATTTGYYVQVWAQVAGAHVSTVVAAVNLVYRVPVLWEVSAVQNGANIDVSIQVNDNEVGSGSFAATLGPVSKVVVNPDRTNTTAAVTPDGLRFIIGHVRVYDASVATTPFYSDTRQGPTAVPVRGYAAWVREAAHRRILRLCAEQRVRCSVAGDPYTTGFTQLNSQREGTFSELLRQAVESESGGLLYEKAFGYQYLPRTARYNRPVALSIDMSSYARRGTDAPGSVLVPQLENRLANVWTVARFRGSSGSASAPAEYVARRGPIGEEVTLDVMFDAQLRDHAGWRVWTNTGSRDAYYPSVPLDLVANPQYIAAWLGVEIGARVQRTNQPTIAGAGVVDQVVEGWTETVGPRVWSVEMDAAPAGVWDAGVADQGARADTAGSALDAAVSAAATTLVVKTLAGPVWSPNIADYPLDVTVDGEQIRLNSPPGGTASPQTFTGVTRAVNGISKPHTADAAVSLFLPTIVAL